MTTDLQTPPPQTDRAAAKSRAADAPTGEVRRFLATSALFVAGLLGATLLFDQAIAAYLRSTHQEGSFGGEVHHALRMATRHAPRVQVIVLGDSVAHQLFSPGTEPPAAQGRVRFLTTNQAITAAGQFYLLRDAVRHYPNLRDAYVFYLPAAWRNDMPRELTHDYFCAYFHSPDEVAEVFATKRDLDLTMSHVGRALMPHVLDSNSLQWMALRAPPPDPYAPPRPTPGTAAPPPDAEKMLVDLSALLAPASPPIATAVPPGTVPVVLSTTSAHYLERMRAFCKHRGVRLHVLPCPVSTVVRFSDPAGVYQAPILNDVPPEKLIDPVHFKPQFIAEARQRVVNAYGLKWMGDKPWEGP